MSKNVLEDKSRQLLRYGTAIVHCSLFIIHCFLCYNFLS